jgi:DNA-directed RNA polymerase alpha subunit
MRHLLLHKVGYLDLSSRAKNCLVGENITRLADLVSRTKDEMAKTPNLGEATLKQIIRALAQYDLVLGMKMTHHHNPEIGPVITSQEILRAALAAKKFK